MTHWPGKRTAQHFWRVPAGAGGPSIPTRAGCGAETVGFFLNPTLPASW